MNTKTLERLHAVLLILYLGACVVAWPYLPERMPVHFDFLGRVTSWMRSSAALWFLLPAFAVALVWFLSTLGKLAARTPEMWNIPRAERERVRALPPDERAALGEFVRRSTVLGLLLLTLTFTGLQLGTFVTAVAQADRMPWYAEAVIIGPLVVLLPLAFREDSELRKRVRAAIAEQDATSGTTASDSRPA